MLRTAQPRCFARGAPALQGGGCSLQRHASTATGTRSGRRYHGGRAVATLQLSPPPTPSRAAPITSTYRRHSRAVPVGGDGASTFDVAVYPGDGIGVEVTRAAFRAVESAQQVAGGFRIAPVWYDWGCDFHDQHGVCAPDDMIDTLRAYHAVFLGAVGYPERLPDHVTLEPLIRMRQHFDQYACALDQSPPCCPSFWAALALRTVVLRENSEGEYVNVGGAFAPKGHSREVALQTAVHTREGVARILRHGFELARTRRSKLTMITKSNAQRYGMVLWDEVLEELAPQYPDVAADKQHVDAAAMNFVRQPECFDVVVASNLFGDILSDLSGAVTGSLGLNPSANLNPERAFPSLFEPVHGSAPDIDGQGVANPGAAVFSAAMMLEWLAGAPECDSAAAAGLTRAAALMREATIACLEHGESTADVGGNLATEACASAICNRILAAA